MIQTVKLQGSGYLVNGNMHVPMADGNRHYEEIKIWLETNTPEPEFTEQELAQQAIDKQIQEYQQYLTSTDHKFFNGYKPKADEDLVAIEAKRDEAREFIRYNKA